MLSIIKPMRVAVVVAALALGAYASGSASADIAGFNAAMKKGDLKTASEEAVEVWAGWDRSDPDTALMAREFGFVALAAGQNERAAEFGSFLVAEGASLKTPDDQPAISLVLLRAAELKIKASGKGREALREALTARSAAPGIDMTSILSWELLYLSDWSAGAWDDASKSAAAAAEFMQRGGDAYASRVSQAEVQSAAATFMEGRGRQTAARNDLYSNMVDAHDRVVDRIDAAPTPAARKGHWEAKWNAEAWAIAIEAYLTSTYKQTGTLFDTKLESLPLKRPRYGEVMVDAPPKPLCSGTFKGDKLVYPTSKAWRGMIGSVIMRLTTDESGKVTSVTELASIPARGFADDVRKMILTWRLVPDSNAEPGCSLKTDDTVYRVMFRFA